MNLKKQYFLYFLFAAISTLLNLSIQKLFEFSLTKIFSNPIYKVKIFLNSNLTLGLFSQMIIATIIGFTFKYLIDKILIFKDKTKYFSANHFIQIFIYGFFAIFTTLIFWITEISFKYFVNYKNSEYLGGLIGLIIGYTVKFFLDRKYVFNNKDD